jgi:hypothetical protein
MTTIKQHIPDFVSGVDPQTAVFVGRESLLAIPWVKQWSDDPEFHIYSLAPDRPMLMAEYDGGLRWHVIGFIKATPRELRALALPEWRAVYKPEASAQAIAPEGGA